MVPAFLAKQEGAGSFRFPSLRGDAVTESSTCTVFTLSLEVFRFLGVIESRLAS